MAKDIVNKERPKIFYDWVPKWLGALVLLYIFVPTMSLSGAYSSNAADIVGGLGIMSEHIMFVTFAAAIGLVIAGPYVLPVLQSFGTRRIYIMGFLVMLALNILCGYTESVEVLAISSFAMGVVRVFVMLNTIFSLIKHLAGVDPMSMLSPAPDTTLEQKDAKNRGRAMLQSITFFLFLTIGQIGSYHTTKIAYEFRWQYAHWYVAVYVLIAILLVMLMIRPSHTRDKSKVSWPPVGKAITAGVFFFAITYVMVYGKTYDWFNDGRIKLSAAIAIISAGAFIIQHRHGRRRLIDPKAFSAPSVKMSIVFFTLVMLLNSSSALSSAFMGMSMKLDSVKSASIGNWQILGFALGMIVNIAMIKKRMHHRWFIAIGFTLITASAVYMYFLYQSMATYELMILPTVMRGMGMWMIYAYCGCMGTNDLDAGKQLGSWVFIMLMFRAVIGPVGGATLYSNAIYQRSEQHIANYVQELDESNTAAANAFKRTQMGMIMQGKSYEEATQMATISSKGSIQLQAMLTTLKELTGWTIWAGIGCIIISLIFPYDRRKKIASEPTAAP